MAKEKILKKDLDMAYMGLSQRFMELDEELQATKTRCTGLEQSLVVHQRKNEDLTSQLHKILTENRELMEDKITLELRAGKGREQIERLLVVVERQSEVILIRTLRG